ncbi:MAG: dehydratase [Nitrospinaceae bacterium]|jgi:acyl dehydratase|nr:dehydratase [Nitrospinaceae bacterium]MBT3434868.1 dehydratase [Nitrospinaceae bacterium]MBT4092930.1 dehydratase [Nitrospinaceae bacterium]MBT4432396.1 dehydratase [Nitrospinaceae bacterium]MBT5370031.1 dehydratase [Nitrospinaceae bacterium]
MEFEPTGLGYDDFEVGRTWCTAARTVGEADVTAFAGLTGDYTYLHTDAQSAAKTPFGGRIAHGLLGLSYLSGLVSRLGILEGTVEAFMGLEMKFRGAIMFDDTVHAEVEVREKRISSKGQGLVTLGMTLKNQRDETVQEGQFVLMMEIKG